MNHTGINQSTSTNYQAWGGAVTKGFTPDNSTLVFQTSYLKWMSAGFTVNSGGDSNTALVAYDINTGAPRLLSHSSISNNDQTAHAAFNGVSSDGKWALFSSADASKFGNNGIAFADNNPSGLDLFASNIKTGEIRLLSGSNGTSTGGISSYVGLSEDGNTAYFTQTNVNGMKTASNSSLVDSATSSPDLVGVRLNLLDLYTSSDTAGGSAGTSFDNITASKSLNLSALIGAGNQGDLMELIGQDFVLVASSSTQTADSSGQASWSISNVSSGQHTYAIFDPTQGVQYILDQAQTASRLAVTVL